MHETTHEDEREAARPNDGTRAALLEVLDLADRAGVQLSCVTAYVSDGRPWGINLHAHTRTAGTRMTHSEALRIALRAARSSAVVVSDVIGRHLPDPYVTIDVRREGRPTLTLFAEPSPAQLEAAVVEAVLQS